VWDLIRAASAGEALDISQVPRGYHDLLAYASLLGVGEGELRKEFLQILADEAIIELFRVVSPARTAEIRLFQESQSYSPENAALLYLAETCSFFRQNFTPRVKRQEFLTPNDTQIELGRNDVG
jgi:hypothetical protein